MIIAFIWYPLIIPKINQEKTQWLQEQQSQSIDSLFHTTQKKTSEHIKNILTQHLWSTNNAKYYEALNILKYARNNNNIASKLFTENMVKTIEEFSVLGMSDKSIADIISIVYDKKCNYYNTEAKIKALWTLSVFDDGWENKINCEKQMKSWIWWECSTLASYVYNKFQDKKLVSQIQKETKKEVVLWTYEWHCDTYFLWDKEHVFLFLDIWNKRYVIDPSLGVLANVRNTLYEDDAAGPSTESNKNLRLNYLDDLLNGAKNWKIILEEWWKKIFCSWEWIPLWFLSDTDIFLGLGFASTNYGKIVPMLAGTTPDANIWVYFLKDNELWHIRKNRENNFWYREKCIPKDVFQKVKNILVHLEQYSQNITLEKENIVVRSGEIRYFNRINWRWFVIKDDGSWDVQIKQNNLDKILKPGDIVKYIEVNGEAVLVE